MQGSALVQKLSRVITKRFLKMLNDESQKNAEHYNKFYAQFAVFIKEGVATDQNYREPLAKLLRYESSYTESGTTTTLDDYVSRMRDEQKEIYYLHALSRQAIEDGPYLEAFKARDMEVLYLFEPVDEFVMSHLSMYAEKRLVPADQHDIAIDDIKDEQKGEALEETEVTDLSRWMRDTLGEKVGDVNSGKRLVDSPIVALNTDKVLTPSMRRIMKQAQGAAPGLNIDKMDLEINPRHPLIKDLNELRKNDSEKAALVCEQLYDNAQMAAGLVEDPRTLVKRMNKILEMAARG